MSVKMAFVSCARMKSTRMPGKVLRNLHGAKLIDYTIDFVKSLGARLHVFTRDLPIMEAVQYLCPIIYEPGELYDTPFDSTDQKMLHCQMLLDVDYIVLLQPTQPVRDINFVKDCINEAVEKHYGYCKVVGLHGEETGLLYIYSRVYLEGLEGEEHTFVWADAWFDIDTEADLERCEQWLQKRA